MSNFLGGLDETELHVLIKGIIIKWTDNTCCLTDSERCVKKW